MASPGRATRAQYLRFHFVIPEAEVLKVGSRVRLHRRELVLQHVNDFRQFWVSPSELPSLHEHIQEKALVINVRLFAD